MDTAYDKEDVCEFLKIKGVYWPGINPRTDVIVKPDLLRVEATSERRKSGHSNPGRCT